MRYQCSEPVPKRCEKTFHAFPGDVSHCPYCGGAVERLTPTKPAETGTASNGSVNESDQ